MLQSVDTASPASPSPQILKCPACGTENTLASRFCRQCGSPLTAASAPQTVGADGVAAAPANGASIPKKAAIEVPEDDGTMDTHGHSVSEEIDARRAKQLLDRALHLGERNEIQAAILACRQAIALAPTNPGGYSMLGMLLERANDVRGAIQAYEKVLQLAPHSALERDSLVRLHDRLEQSGAARPATVVETPLDSGGISAAAPGLAAATVPATPVADRRGGDRRQVNIPVAVERRRKRDRRAAQDTAATPAPAIAAPIAPAPVTPVAAPAPKPVPRVASALLTAPGLTDLDEERLTPLQTLVRHPNFYWRGFPLVVTAVLSLGFIAWARGYAVNNTATAIVETQPQAEPTAAPVQPASVDTQPAEAQPQAAPPGANNKPSVVISNEPNKSRPASGTTATRVASRPAGNPAIPSPDRETAPMPIGPAPIPSGPSSIPNSGPGEELSSNAHSAASAHPTAAPGGSSGLADLPRPRVDAPAPAPEPVQALPPDTPATGGFSSGGAPVNPAGSPGRGYVRITQGRLPSSAPVRPNNAARNDEGRAAAAARGGQSDAAINNLTSAINNSEPNDLGFRYQQRASLFMERGEYNRAIDDFQSAISAYNDQINRGEQVKQAQAGIKSARAGMNLAVSAARRG